MKFVTFNRLRNLLLIGLLFVFTGIRSQILDKNYYLIDSLDKSKISNTDFNSLTEGLTLYHKLKNDTDRIQLISELVENIYDETIWTKYNSLMLITASKKENIGSEEEKRIYSSMKALALNNIGYYYYNFSNYIDSAEYYYRKGLEINEKNKDIDNLVVSYSNLANVYQNKGDYEKALELFNKALSYEPYVKKDLGILSAMNNIANIYLYLGDTITSLSYLKRCFLIVKKGNDQSMKAHLLHNMGTLMARKKDAHGIQSIKTALSIRRRIGDKKGIANSLLVLSSLMLSKKDITTAQTYLKEAEPYVFELNNPNNMALYFRSLGDIEEIKGNIKQSVEYYKKAIEKFKEAKNLNDLVNALENTADLCSMDKDLSEQKNNFLAEHYYYNKQLNKGNAQRLAAQFRYENELKIKEAEQKLKDEKNQAQKRIQNSITIAISCVLGLTLIFAFFIFKSLKLNKQKNKEISLQKHLIEEKQKEIIDSINYAKRIQSSFLPSVSEFNSIFPDSFVIYQPKDIVSGDFYWAMDSNDYTTVQKNFRSVAVADCTGHGVPGSILSMLGSSIINQAILDNTVMSTADLLNFLNTELKKNLRSTNNEVIRDGMDIACCIIFNDTLKMQYSGANNPCWILRNGNIIELKANKQAVTASHDDNSLPFTLTEFQLQKNDHVYLFTDGYADQFGGPKGKKFKYKQLEQLFIRTSALSSTEQRNEILTAFMNWKGELDQVDDVCLLGIRIS